ncbi:MAG TPA: citrate/2-methylcitrate synthase [Phycisphaerales bacterium]|nr:citrate/2-methylcitrate synthase [Phycisphaerales bacterium]
MATSISAPKGLEGIVAAETQLSFIDGEQGILEYVGIAIDDLARNSTFEETVFLLWNFRLPNKAELDQFTGDIRANYDIPEGMEQRILSTPKNAQPMHMLRTAISGFAMHDPDPNATDLPSVRAKSLRVLAQAPTVLAYFDRYRRGLPFVRPDRSLSLAENFLYMLNGTKPTPTMAKALDVCLVLHADHGLNNSTFAARVIISTLSDLYSALTGAVGSLRGPLHGGANEDVMRMLAQIPTVDAAENFILGKLERKEKIAGFGHRVYRAYDPRATFLKTLAKQLAADTGNSILFEKSQRIEEVMNREKAAKGIYPNVDFYSATTYHCIGLKLDLFTPMFAVSRIAGWCGHVLEQLADNRLYRPTVDYVGPHNVAYTPIGERG